MKENIKLALIGIIAITLVLDTFFLSGETETGKASSPKNKISNNTTPAAPTTPDLNPAPVIEDPVPSGPTTLVQFAENIHDFGQVNQDSENKYVFKFTNTGSEPLIIENAKGSCGCTVPTYPKEPVAPGATGEIEVVYKPGKQNGSQTKTVTVTANTEPRNTTVQIKAEVLSPES